MARPRHRSEREVNQPGTISARNWQLRVVKDFGSWASFGLSVENPAELVYSGVGAVANGGNVGGWLVSGALVITADESKLHGHLERRLVDWPGEAGEDRSEQLFLQVVHDVVHVRQRRRHGGVGIRERVNREVHLHACLRAHAFDDSPNARRQLAGIEAAGSARHVAHQTCRELDLMEDAQHREHAPQV